MTIGELQKLNILEVVNAGEEPDRELKSEIGRAHV